MKTKIIFSAILLMFITSVSFAQQVKKEVDPFKYKMEDNKLKLEKTYFSLGKVTNKDMKKDQTAIFNDSDFPMEITFTGVPKHVNIQVSPKTIPAKTKAIIKITYDVKGNKDHKGKQKWGFQNDRVRLIVNGNNKNSRNNLNIRANIQEDFSNMSAEELASAPSIVFENQTFDFGKANQGDNVVHEFKFKNTGKRDLEIRKVKGS